MASAETIRILSFMTKLGCRVRCLPLFITLPNNSSGPSGVQRRPQLHVRIALSFHILLKILVFLCLGLWCEATLDLSLTERALYYFILSVELFSMSFMLMF